MTRVFAALLWWALLLAAPAHAQNFPQPNNTRVVDAADIIPAGREAALDAKLKALEDNSTRQLAVATIPDLEGYDIADYGYRLGRAWGIGQQGENNGAMLIVAPNDRKVRIEVGYGLEPILTDAFSSVVINTQIVPRFKAGDYPGGVEAGVDALVTQLTLPPEEARKVAASAETPASDENWGAVIFWLFVLFFFILPALWPLFFGRRKRGKRHRGSGPIVVWGPGDWGSGGSSSWGSGGSSSWGGGGSSWGGGGFSGGGGSFGGGGASGGW